MSLTTTPLTPVWTSSVNRKLPAVDIVSYTFGKEHESPPETPIFVNADDPSSYLTFNQVYELVIRLCKGWHEVGLESTECVTICCPNNILYPPIWLSVIGSGAVVSGVNPSLTVSELEHHFQVTHSQWLIAHRRHAKCVLSAAARCQISRQHIFLFDDDLINFEVAASSSDRSTSASPSATSDDKNDHDATIKAEECADLSTLLVHGERRWKSHKDSLKAAVHATTSGTTGLPKAAVLPHQYLVSQAMMLEEEYRSRVDPIQLICLPVFHSFGGNCALVLPLRLGITTYFSPRFRVNDFIEAVSRFSITDVPVVPPIVSTLVQQGEKLADKLHCLRRIICAGSPMKQAVQSALYKHLHPDCRVSQCWGATETGWLTLTSNSELDESGSVGQLTMNTQLKIVDEEHVIHEEGERGEARIKTTSLFLGYLENDAANESAFDQEGFYKTGDRAFFQDGKVFIEGRIKDTLKVKGWQVSPEELEEKIQGHPSVVDCAVVGHDIADAAGLEQTHPRAYVVVSQNSSTTVQAIYDWVASQTVHYKHLTGGIFFVDNIPRNASGKILRRVLTERGAEQC